MDTSPIPPQPPQDPAVRRTTLKDRLLGFLLCHFIYDAAFLFLLCVAAGCFARAGGSLAPSAPSKEPVPSGVPVLILLIWILCMAVYFFLGVLKARLGKWTAPTRREALSVIGWSCGGTAVVLALLVVGVDVFGGLVWICAILAAPSCFFALLSPLFFPSVGGAAILVFLPPAAILPALLFALGSFFPGKGQNFSLEA